MSAVTDAKHFGRPDHQPLKKTGRPSGFSQEIADKICSHIAEGGYATNLKRFGLPHEATVCRWLNENEAFREAYARARERRAEVFADQMVEIADTCEDPQKGRLQIETRKWIASKLLPRVYGENQRVEVQHTISETAARVLADLSQRQKERKALERQVIDVTPVHSLDEGGVKDKSPSNINASGVGCTSTTRVLHAGAVQDEAGAASPPVGGASSTPPLPEPSSFSDMPSEKNTVTPARNANAERQRRYRERRAALKKSAAP